MQATHHCFALCLSLPLVGLLLVPCGLARAAEAPQVVRDALRSGQSVGVLVEIEASAVKQRAKEMASAAKRVSLGAAELAFKRSEYAKIKEVALTGIQGVTVVQDFENLTHSFVRVDTEAALDALLARPAVRAVHENERNRLFLAETLPFIQQTAVAAAGVGGQGRTVAILDTGVDYTQDAFGPCTAPGEGEGCRVVATFEAAPDDSEPRDDVGHGTNISGIVAGTAPGANLVVADVCALDSQGDFGCSNQDIEEAISWAIGISVRFNIVSMNLSLGNSQSFTTPCGTAPLASPLQDAFAVGIQPVVAAGNRGSPSDSFTDGVAHPACVPEAVAVGAVYDDDYGSQNWVQYTCTDSTTAADRVTCFSQTSSFLRLLAPGSFVAAAGSSSRTGTSQAAPHVAGAWAVMRAAMPGAFNEEVLSILQAQGVPVTDTRPNPDRTTSRLDLFAALDTDVSGGPDGVLFPLDNCVNVANGPGQGPANQVDVDADGLTCSPETGPRRMSLLPSKEERCVEDSTASSRSSGS